MSWYSKVVWKEGLFMQPQHFQQSDRHFEKQLESRTRLTSPYPWGFSDLRVDSDLLQQGKVGLTSVSGIFPDGLAFDAPQGCALPKSVDVPEGSDGLGIWLTLPDIAMNGRETAGRDEEETATRYFVASETVADATASMQREEQLQVSVPRLEIDIRKTPKQGYQCLKMAEILEIREKDIVLSQTYAPPLLTVQGSNVSIGWVDRVVGWVEAKLSSLSRYAADPSAGGGLQATDYFMLLLLNREINVLRHFGKSRYVHPERLYEALLRLSGELATFDTDNRRATEYAPYNHEDLNATFEPVLRDIQRLLSLDLGRATRLDLQELRANSFMAQVNDRHLFRDANFVLEVEAQIPLTQIQQQFAALVKIGPNTRMQEIVTNNLPGIEITHTPTPPRQIRAVSSNVYFILDKNSALWSEFSTAPGIGMHFAGDWPGLKLDLWAVVESNK